MIRPKAQESHHSLIQQILALALAWLAVAASLPTNILSSPLPPAARVRFAIPAGAALPRSEALPEPPNPGPSPAASNNADEEAKKWGEITVGQPKIWQYERVNSLLDGLLRDVQGVSMSDLIALDANATNGAAVKFVQSMIEIGVQYNQGAAATNAITLKNYAATQGIASAQIQANSAYLQQLYSERSSVTGQLLAAMQLNTTLQGQLATTDPTTDAYKSLTTQQQAAASQVTSLQADLTSINSQITAASSGTIPPAPTLTPTTGGTAPETANTFSSFLGNLPPALTTNIVNQLQSPSLPATKRLDNFITLLYERMAREISVLQDDVMRDTENVPFLVQFDVGLYPSSRAKNHVGVVEFTMNCDGCKVYSIYPGQSSYNLANYEGTSKRYSLYGALQTLFGFGINADYRRQTDTLHGDLVQSVYMSGFQEGAPTTDRDGNPGVRQRFGWYYGEAPFEQLVTPGIRTTFALISVPRAFVKECFDSHPPINYWSCGGGMEGETDNVGTTKIMLHVKAHTDWVRRDDPYYQKAHWYESKNIAGANCPSMACKELKIILPGTDGINDIPDVVLAERNRLHVLGMEYNPVYYPLPPQPAPGASSNPQPPPPGTASATASGAGTGTTTVTVSGAGTASATSSGTTSTTATATAANPTSTPSATAAPPNALTGCQSNQCAAVLVKLAEPIDPNMVVTVRGLPLRRVRDWRGRATSVLPPAQSASDLTSPATLSTPGLTGAPAKPLGAENAASASLFEVDAPGPDTWMEVHSHRILLNISKGLAGDNTAFPTIQIVDPAKRALFLPLELDTGFSELITNGFHFPARDKDQLVTHLGNHLRTKFTRAERGVADDLSLHPSGPYAPETFLPLFLPNSDPQPIYAYLGETGVQILIGLEKMPPDPTKTGPPPTPKKWLAGNTQVVLEDRYLDLAWSLSCYPQSPMLVCDVPTREIRDAYKIVQRICKDENACPSMPGTLDDTALSISSLQVWVEQYDPDGNDSFHSSVPAHIGRFPVQPAKDSKRANVGYRPWYFESANPNWVKLTGCNYPEFPDKRNDNGNDLNPQAVTILGRGIPERYRTQVLQITRAEEGCKWFAIPTLALTYQEVVIEYPPFASNSGVSTDSTDIPYSAKSSDLCRQATSATPCAPESLSAALFQPSFDDPIAIPQRNANGSDGRTPPINQWTIDIPVSRAECNDTLDILSNTSGLSAYWRIGAVPRLKLRSLNDPLSILCKDRIHNSIFESADAAMAKAKTDTDNAKRDSAKAGSDAGAKAKAAKEIANAEKETKDAQALMEKAEAAQKVAPDWDEASKNGQLMLEFVLNRGDLDKLPLKNPARVLRGPLLSKIGTLPDLRPSFLPTKLTIVSTGTNQFVLQGSNAGVIDAVTVQGPDGVTSTIPTVSAGQTAFVTLPSSKSDTPNKPPVIENIANNSVPGGTRVNISGSGFGAAQGSVSFGKIQADIDTNCWSPTSITVDVPLKVQPGQVAVTVATKSPASQTSKPFSLTVVGKPLDRVEPTNCPAQPSGISDNTQTGSGPKAGAYSIVPLIALSFDKNGKPQQFMPLDVLDPNGKPLTFTVADSKSAGATTPKGVDSPTTTLTISKKTTVTPPATTGGGQ